MLVRFLMMVRSLVVDRLFDGVPVSLGRYFCFLGL